MSEQPTDWLTARILIHVNRKNDGPGATPYGWMTRTLAIPTRPAMPDVIALEVLEGHSLLVKTHPLTWDAARQHYTLGDMTLVLLAPEIEQLHAKEPESFRRNPG